MATSKRDPSIPPPGIRTPDFLCSGADALTMLPEGAGYVMIQDFKVELLAAGYVKTARELAEQVKGWCHICDTPQHRCPSALHMTWTPPDGGTPVNIVARCKRSACEHCGPIYVREWRDHIEEDLAFWLNLGGRFQVYWFTQTFDPDTQPLPFDDPDAHKRVTVLTRNLVRELRSRYGNCEYTVVIEPHKSGQIHVHAFLALVGAPGQTDPILRTRCTAQHRGGYNRHRPPAERLPEGACICTLTGNREPCIQTIANRLGYGFNNLQRLTSANAISKYVTKRLGKYITKTVTSWDRPRYARALRMSRHFAVETHGAYKQRIADRYKARFADDRCDRSGGTWQFRGAWNGYAFADDTSARIVPRSVVAADHRRLMHTQRPDPPPPVAELPIPF